MTFSTHDDVVNIIRQSGKSLHMKVITPILDTTLRTSVQLKEQVEIMSSSNSLGRQRSNERPVKRDNSFKTQFSAGGTPQMGTATMPQRETVIDDVPLSRQSTKGGDSPNLERINQSGWDSSQDEASNVPTTPSRVQKFSYLHPANGPPYSQQYSPTRKQKVPPMAYHQGSSTSLSSTSDSSQTVQERENILLASKSATLPPAALGFQIPPMGSSEEEEEEEEESAFAKALKVGKEKLVNSPAIRKRSSTMPSSMKNRSRPAIKRSPAESPFFGNKRSPPSAEKASSAFNQPQASTPTFKQPLAAALMRKIDSVRIDNEQVTKSSDEDDPFSKTPPTRSKIQQPGAMEKSPPPPAPKPKSQMRRAYTVDPRYQGTGLENGSSHPPPFGSSVDVPAEGAREEQHSDEETSSGRMNWKSGLRPVKRTELGKGSPAPPDIPRGRNNSSGSNSLNQSPRRAPLPPSEPVANNLTPFAVDPDHLPPPLPANAIDNRLSINFLNLPPPAEFMLVPGAEIGETSTDPTSGYHQGSRPSSGRTLRTPSPPPPPPPDSSPPREPVDTSPLVGVKFPPLTKQTALTAYTQDDTPFKVPSPIPSPMNAGSFETETEPILPPNEFIPTSELQGFRIPTPPGFEIPTPPNDDFASTSNGSDLNEAIRQLQLLSEGLGADTSPQSKPRQDELSGKKPEAVHGPPVVPEPATVPEVPVHLPPSSRSRSSTSSSNVSSLNRYHNPCNGDSVRLLVYLCYL